MYLSIYLYRERDIHTYIHRERDNDSQVIVIQLMLIIHVSIPTHIHNLLSRLIDNDSQDGGAAVRQGRREGAAGPPLPMRCCIIT